jgi:ribonuclease BN (tRNA processing enzyme)
MEITILGSGTCVPSLKRGSSGLILRIGERILLFDSGTGTLERMLKGGITHLDLDMVLYTHTKNLRERDLPIIGGRGFKTYFQAIQEVYGRWLQPDLFKIPIREVYDDILDYDLFRVIARPMTHLPESVAYRVESNDGKKVVLSGDTDYCPELVDLAKDVDVLVIESSLPDEMKAEGHLTPSLAGRIGREANCKKLVLTHLYPSLDNAKRNTRESCLSPRTLWRYSFEFIPAHQYFLTFSHPSFGFSQPGLRNWIRNLTE